MKKILDIITDEMRKAFAANGYDENFAKVTLSNRPDLCEYQCNGAMAAAKTYKKKPIDIANEVVEKTAGSKMFSEINAVMPGFINIRLRNAWPAFSGTGDRRLVHKILQIRSGKSYGCSCYLFQIHVIA